MKSFSLIPLSRSILLIAAVSTPLVICAQPPAATPAPPASAGIPASPPPKAGEPAPAAVPEEWEAAFVKTLANVTFKGRWSSVENGVLGEAKPESYEIAGVMKTGGDRWVINARIQYGKVNLVAPVPVQVKWAGDTPVIVVDRFSLPGAGTYSARVMIFENTYSGTWSAGDHGGLLHGLILPNPAK